MEAKFPEWLSIEGLMDQGPQRGLYPYPLPENILSPDNCRNAALNETRPFENECGPEIAAHFYRLLWRLNTIGGIFTSHTNTSPPNYESPYPWARAYIGSTVLILPRKLEDRRNRPAAEGMALQLVNVIAASTFIPTDSTGWQIRLFPTVVNLAYEAAPAHLVSDTVAATDGFGHEPVISGSAGTRRRAAERWSRAVTFVCDTLAHVPDSSPYQHPDIVNGVVHFPRFPSASPDAFTNVVPDSCAARPLGNRP